ATKRTYNRSSVNSNLKFGDGWHCHLHSHLHEPFANSCGAVVFKVYNLNSDRRRLPSGRRDKSFGSPSIIYNATPLSKICSVGSCSLRNRISLLLRLPLHFHR